MNTLKTQVFAVISLISVAHGPVHAENSADVSFRNNLVSIQATNASLLDIATELQHLSGVLITPTEGNDRTITLSVINESLEKAVQKLAGNILVKRDAKQSIVEFILLLDGSDAGQSDANLPSGDPVDEISNEQQLDDTLNYDQQLDDTPNYDQQIDDTPNNEGELVQTEGAQG